jgi:hypothetical protein
MSQILSIGLKEIKHPFVVVCEGSGDARFVFELLRTRQVENCSVGYPNETDSGSGGKDAIGKYLRAISGWFAAHPEKVLRGILILLDADDNPDSAFELARKALQDVGFLVPGRPFLRALSDGFTSAVYLIPGIKQSGELETGTLEDVLLKAAFERNPQFQGCLDQFMGCIGKTVDVQPNKQAKMRMSALVGGSFPSNPWASVDRLLASSKNNIVPIDSPHFKHLADFLAEFCTE